MPEATHPGHPHGAMRRKDREITDRMKIDAILDAGRVLYLALADDNIPFVVPVFYAYDHTALFFHCARAGTKVRIMQHNPSVSFAVSLDHGVVESDAACDFEARHRTVIGHGRTVFVTDEAAKIAALDRIVARFTPQRFEYPKTNLAATTVVRIEIDAVKGKTHGLA
uniref:Putative flavin-nucleotide-binding protein n=1 Tax=Desulfovibrio sp. U5L TaxID=596152 RepID=I2Q3U9_9BACT